MSSVVEAVAPERLGTSFRWLLASSWLSNIGDGVAIAAGPLLVASQTHSKFLVALAALLQWLPPLLFGLVAGALTDRLDRRLIVVAVDLLRCAILALIAVVIVTGVVTIWVLLLSRCSCWARPSASPTTPPAHCCRCWCTATNSVRATPASCSAS